MSWIHSGIVNYLFIDGNYLTTLAKDMGIRWFGQPADLDFKKVAGPNNPKRTFYYDCLPVKKDSQQDAEFEALKSEKAKFFDQLRELDGWHVSPGIAHWRPGRPARQKEVDVQLTVDLLTNVHRKNMEAVTLIAGDLDFRPLIEAVVREGMYVRLIHGGNSNEALVNAADESMIIGPYELFEYCTDSFRRNVAIPQRSGQLGMPNGDVLELAHQDGIVVGQLQAPTGGADLLHKLSISFGPGDGRYMVYRSRDVAQLKTFSAFCHGPLDWRECK